MCATACGSTGPEVEARHDASPDAELSIDASRGLDSGVADASRGLDSGVADAAGDAAALIDANARDALTSDAAVMRIACDGPGAVLPGVPIVAPDRATYMAAIASVPATSTPPTTFTVDPYDCSGLLWEVYLPLGSAFALVIPHSDGTCSVWLGGEEEDPEYNGMPRSYCRFDRRCRPMELAANLAGPASIDSPWCIPAGFCTHHCTE